LSAAEVILAEEQGASRNLGSLHKKSGTLILTNKRLVFMRGNKEIRIEVVPEIWRDIVPNIFPSGLPAILGFAEVYDTAEIPSQMTFPDVSIDLASIISATPERPVDVTSFRRSSRLVVSWNSSIETKIVEFEEHMSGRPRKINLNDWGDVIMKIKSGYFDNLIRELINSRNSSQLEVNSIEANVYFLLGDLQSKSTVLLSKEMEERFATRIDFERIQQACDRLERLKLIAGTYDTFWNDGDLDRPPFYRKYPPLGSEYDLSS